MLLGFISPSLGFPITSLRAVPVVVLIGKLTPPSMFLLFLFSTLWMLGLGGMGADLVFSVGFSFGLLYLELVRRLK